jgi:hypothetical protein
MRFMNSAQAGDLFMNLIHTCEVAGANPFDYLSAATSRGVDALEPSRPAGLKPTLPATIRYAPEKDR